MQYQRSLLAAALLALVPMSEAATVEVSWKDPQEFRDILTVNDNQLRFQERVMTELEEEIRDETLGRLEEGQSLKVEVDDLDLAGEIEYFHPNYPFGLRVVRNVDFPQMTLSYELRAADGTLLKSGTRHIADLGFRFTTLIGNDRTPLRYEKQMIKEWSQSL